MSQQQQQHRGGGPGRGGGRGSSGGNPRGGGFGSGNMRGGLGGENGRGGGASASASVSSTPVDPEQVRKWLIAIREVPTMVISGLLPAVQAEFDEALRQYRMEQHLLTVKQTSTTPQTQPTQGGQLHQQGQNRSQQAAASTQAQNAGPSRTAEGVTTVFTQLPPGGRGPKPALRSAKMTVEELGPHWSGKIWIRVNASKGAGYWRPKEWEPIRKMGAYRFETMSRAPPVGVFPDCTMDWWRQDRKGEWTIGEEDFGSWEEVKDSSEASQKIWLEQHGFNSECVGCHVLNLQCDHGFPCRNCKMGGRQCQYKIAMVETRDCPDGVLCTELHLELMNFWEKYMRIPKSEILTGVQWKFPLSVEQMGVEWGTRKLVGADRAQYGDVFDMFDMPNKGMANPRSVSNPLGFTASPSPLKPVWILEHFSPLCGREVVARSVEYWTRKAADHAAEAGDAVAVAVAAGAGDCSDSGTCPELIDGGQVCRKQACWRSGCSQRGARRSVVE
ncbi:hypothetical protein LTR17_010234 [Elasticomyces elasticus]|nr:hypothetical protein LTR17_010234 [Elasticomyces elasticus]